MNNSTMTFAQVYQSPIKDSKYLFKDSFSFTINKPAEEVFRVVSNTSLVNKKLNFAPREEREVDGELLVETKMIGKDLAWIEKPWRWSFGKYIVSHRIHSKSLFKTEFAVIHLNSIETNETKVTFYYEAEVKSIFMKWILGLTYQSFGKKYGGVVRSLCDEATTWKANLENPLVQEMARKLQKKGLTKNIANNMAHLIIEGEDDDIFKIQIPKLAREWDIPVEELIPAFLMASKEGYFELCWDTVCPHCKGSRSRSLHLEDLLFQNTCGPCDLTFELDDIDFIDVTFKINDEMRKVPEVNFCAAEPFKKSHIYFQERIKAGEEYDLDLELTPENYRVRILGQEETYVFQVTSNDKASYSWNLKDSNVVKNASSKLSLNLKNSFSEDKTVIFEKIVPPENYLSPIKVFNSAMFRKVYAGETIAKGIQLKLPEQIILFTDVVDSTKFYQKVGDKEAFRQIKLHFDVVEKIMEQRNGIIIKTIGDAVMATFNKTEDVFFTARKICEELEAHPEIDFKMRLSVHKGPMIAVNYNTGVDYFGDNVNLSAKLQAISEANEISYSEEIFKDVQRVFPNLPFEKKSFLEDKTGYLSSVFDIK